MTDKELRDILIRYTEQLRSYIHESGNNLAYDDRESAEFVDIFLKSEDKTGYQGEMDMLTLSNEQYKEKMGWQPIETAPKDGTAILVCFADHYDTNGFLPVAVRWRSYHPNAKGKECFRDSSGVKVTVITHWMPLPNPPKKVLRK